jgi:hypothetical protein
MQDVNQKLVADVVFCRCAPDKTLVKSISVAALSQTWGISKAANYTQPHVPS